MLKKVFTFLIVILLAALIGCTKDENPVNGQDNSDIPPDPTNVTVPQTTINNVQPTATFNVSSNSSNRIQMNLTGIINPVTNQPMQFTANGNLFITEDGVVQGIKVTQVGTGNVLKADVVFTVDNSGSMGEEADSIAASIIRFAQFLQASGLDVRFAIVGYSGNANGGINFTAAASIEEYLNRNTGTSRTFGFAGPDSASLEQKANSFAPGIFGENGVVGVFFADSNYSWRSDAARVFINFTDEATQPSSQQEWSTESLCMNLSGSATVHTVWSGDQDTANAYSWQQYIWERPWEMSQCTGGTFVQVSSDAGGLDLSTLPVAGALANSYLVEFVSSNSAVPHTVVITIKENNADGKRTYTNITY